MGGDETAAVTIGLDWARLGSIGLDAGTLFFLLGVAVDCFLATLKTERRWVRNLLRGMTGILVLAAFSWPFLSKLLPTFAASMTSVVSNAWAWFALVIATAVIGSLDSVIKQWWANHLPASSVATTLPPLIETPTEGNVSLALSRVAAASTTIDTGQAPPAVVFVVEESWVSHAPEEKFPLKLWLRWANEGVDISLGRPRWASEKVGYQGQRVGQGPMCRFKHTLGKASVESNSMTAPCGQRGEMWFALDPSFDVEQVRRWKEAKQLGLLVLPIVVGLTTKMEIQVQL